MRRAVVCLMPICGHKNVLACTVKCATIAHLLIIAYYCLSFFIFLFIYACLKFASQILHKIYFFCFLSLLLPPFAFLYSLSSLLLTHTHTLSLG